MEKDWKRVFKTTQVYEANVLEAKLREHGIEAHIVNKQDSAYGVLLPGNIELYVPEAHEARALEIIETGLEDTRN